LLKETIEAARRCQVLKRSDLKRVNVDTTVQEKAIAFPADSGLNQKMRIKLVKAAGDREIKLRQSYVRKGKKSLVMQSRYRHANPHLPYFVRLLGFYGCKRLGLGFSFRLLGPIG